MPQSALAPSWLRYPDDGNELAAGVWSRGARRNASGEIEVAGLSTVALAAEFGTPLYVVDEADARSRARELREAFERELATIGTSLHVYYAGKAFLSTEVARWMVAEGLRIDVCSSGELSVARAAGVDPVLIGFHGNNKSLAEIDEAVACGVGAIILDSIAEIARVADAADRLGRCQSVRLRVNNGVHAHTHEFLATASEDQKFGIPLAEVPDAVASIRSHSALNFLGLHCHIGSQIFGSEGFTESTSRLLALHGELLAGGPVPELNLGGGFGIAYTAADDPTPIAELARELTQMIAATCERFGVPVPVIALEPGRSIIGPAGMTLYTAGTVKDVPVSLPAAAIAPAAASPGESERTAVRRYVSVDGGMSDNVRPALYGADYTVRIASRDSAADPVLVRIAGKHCESGDIVVRDDYLPGDIASSDLLAVPATGAYCWSLASNYNYLGRAAVIAVRDGRARVLVRAETTADLLARDAGITGEAISAPNGAS